MSAANKSESPGRKGVTTKPVSIKITMNRIAGPCAILLDNICHVLVEMQKEIKKKF
jgi:hypothetical protein